MSLEYKDKEIRDGFTLRGHFGSNYPKLFKFLKKKKLQIRSLFAGTDLDCAYGIYNESYDFYAPREHRKKYPFVDTFYYGVHTGTGFNPKCTLDDYSINEDEFIEYLNKKLGEIKAKNINEFRS